MHIQHDEDQRRSEDRELNQARSKPDTVDRPVRTARTFVRHCNSTQYCNTETVFSIFPFLQTNITSQMWPSGGKGVQTDPKAPPIQYYPCLVRKTCHRHIRVTQVCELVTNQFKGAINDRKQFTGSRQL